MPRLQVRRHRHSPANRAGHQGECGVYSVNIGILVGDVTHVAPHRDGGWMIHRRQYLTKTPTGSAGTIGGKRANRVGLDV